MSRIYSGHCSLERRAVVDLTFPEQLVVWAFRQWSENPRNWGVVEQEFRLRCKRLNAMVALNGLSGLISVLSRRARRTLWFHRVWCPGMSADERTLLTLIAAGQADNDAHVRALLHWLLPDDAVETGAAHALRLAAGLRAANQILPQRALVRKPPRRVRLRVASSRHPPDLEAPSV